MAWVTSKVRTSGAEAAVSRYPGARVKSGAYGTPASSVGPARLHARMAAMATVRSVRCSLAKDRGSEPVAQGEAAGALASLTREISRALRRKREQFWSPVLYRNFWQQGQICVPRPATTSFWMGV